MVDTISPASFADGAADGAGRGKMVNTIHLPADTYTVSAIAGEVQVVLQQAYSSLWIAGEAQRLRSSANGHLYFELVEKGVGDRIVGKLEAVVWRGDHQRIRRTLDTRDVLAEGQEIRCRGNLDFYPVGGRLQFIVREIDPVFTLGLLARRRQEVLADLQQRDLATLNGGKSLALLPLDIGLVTAPDSAAYHDFVSSLRESGYGFRVAFAPAAVQGPLAQRELASSLRRLSSTPSLAAIVVIRGGGSRSDLAAFDSRLVSEAVCRSRLPVLTGLGHEIDQAVVDLVAHSAFKTPTAVAEFLVSQVSEQDSRLREAQRSLRREALAPIRNGRSSLRHAVLGLRSARLRVAESSALLRGLGDRIGSSSRRLVLTGQQASERLADKLALLGPRVLSEARSSQRLAAQRLVDLSRSRAREGRSRLEALEHLLRELSPERVLRRGFSITRDVGGRALRRVSETGPDQKLTTELATGTLTSVVTKTAPIAPPDSRTGS